MPTSEPGPGDFDLRDQRAVELLERGALEPQGRLIDASNATLLCTVELDGFRADCIYKPVQGERPLWDFPDGTLAGREVAAYLISEAAGWHLVPPTLLRDGPFGPGMVQLWVTSGDGAPLVDVLAPTEVPDGWHTILQAQDQHGDPVILAHADHPRVRDMAVFDVVLNNSDRKGAHVLHAADGEVFGVDHGVSLHTENKLRTVLWGWVGQPLLDDETRRLEVLRAQLDGTLATRLAEHLTAKEVHAISERIEGLLTARSFPEPSDEWPPIPWPAI